MPKGSSENGSVEDPNRNPCAAHSSRTTPITRTAADIGQGFLAGPRGHAFPTRSPRNQPSGDLGDLRRAKMGGLACHSGDDAPGSGSQCQPSHSSDSTGSRMQMVSVSSTRETIMIGYEMSTAPLRPRVNIGGKGHLLDFRLGSRPGRREDS